MFITLFRSITLLWRSDNIMQNIPPFRLNVGNIESKLVALVGNKITIVSPSPHSTKGLMKNWLKNGNLLPFRGNWFSELNPFLNQIFPNLDEPTRNATITGVGEKHKLSNVPKKRVKLSPSRSTSPTVNMNMNPPTIKAICVGTFTKLGLTL